MNKKLKSLLAGSALIVPIITLFSSQKDANAFKINMLKLPTRTTNPTVKLQTPKITPIKVGSTVKKHIQTSPKKTLENIHKTDPQLAKSLDKLGEIIKTNKLTIVKNTDTSNKPPTVPPRNDQTYASVGESPYEKPTDSPIYENVLTLRNNTNTNSTGLKKRPAYNPNKGKAPQPPSVKSSSLANDPIYEEID